MFNYIDFFLLFIQESMKMMTDFMVDFSRIYMPLPVNQREYMQTSNLIICTIRKDHIFSPRSRDQMYCLHEVTDVILRSED